jgi:CMP-N-acetylneuraminic acid synthetase
MGCCGRREPILSMRVLGVIPARAGSKSVPRKNIAPLIGKPLICYTIEAALASMALTDVVVSTDDDAIADVSRGAGALVPFVRPAELATDSAESIGVILHALDRMESLNSVVYDAVMMLQPTSPLRRAEQIAQAVGMLEKAGDADGVVSIVDVEGWHPFRMKRLVGDRVVNFIDQGFEDMRPRQALPKVYIRSGSIYLIRRGSLLRHKMLVGPNTLGLVIDDHSAINIDNRLDFAMAEVLLRETQKAAAT